MHASFSFCGTDVEDLGLSYAPEIENTYVLKPSVMNSQIESFDGHHGGYFYGSWAEPKEFTLRCIFEEKSIEKGIMTTVYNLFKVGRSGKLVFSRSPWCYYYATVTDPIEEDFTNYLNGSIVIHMKAMYPFGRCDSFICRKTDPNYFTIMQNTAMFDDPAMVPITKFYNLYQESTILLANPGTERAPLSIGIAGNAGDGVVIRNTTNGQECKFVAFSKEKTSDIGIHVYTDGMNGKTMLVGDNFKQIAFMYHDYGFISLEPSFPAIRNVFETHENTDVIHITNRIEEDIVGQYIFIEDNWRKIIEKIDAQSFRINDTVGQGQSKTMIVRMNEIVVSPVSEMQLTLLDFTYKPTFA